MPGLQSLLFHLKYILQGLRASVASFVKWRSASLCFSQSRPSVNYLDCSLQGFPGGANGKEPACRCRRHKRWGFDPWID